MEGAPLGCFSQATSVQIGIIGLNACQSFPVDAAHPNPREARARLLLVRFVLCGMLDAYPDGHRTLISDLLKMRLENIPRPTLPRVAASHHAIPRMCSTLTGRQREALLSTTWPPVRVAPNQ